MNIILLIFTCIVTVTAGRVIFRKWFNHITVYSVIWAASLVLFEIRFIKYTDLRFETWLIIYSAWLTFVLGSILGMLIFGRKNPIQNEPEKPVAILPPEKVLRSLILFLTVVAAIGVIYHWRILFAQYGSLKNILVWSTLRYSLRVHEGTLALPYFDSLAVAACGFAGLYAAQKRGFPLVSILPAATVVVSEIATVGRVKILMAFILFLSAYFIGKHIVTAGPGMKKMSYLRTVIGVAAVVAIFISGAELVRSSRGGLESAVGGASTQLKRFQSGVLITPSVYMYGTIHHGVFNAYLDEPYERRFFGQYTFAPLWRILNKLGSDLKPTDYAPFYDTPIPANTGSYLKELHSDFGLPGVVIGPFVIGLLCSLAYSRATHSRRFVLPWIMISIHLTAGVAISFLAIMFFHGFWFVSLLVSLAFSFVFVTSNASSGGKATL